MRRKKPKKWFKAKDQVPNPEAPAQNNDIQEEERPRLEHAERAILSNDRPEDGEVVQLDVDDAEMNDPNEVGPGAVPVQPSTGGDGVSDTELYEQEPNHIPATAAGADLVEQME